MYAPMAFEALERVRIWARTRPSALAGAIVELVMLYYFFGHQLEVNGVDLSVV